MNWSSYFPTKVFFGSNAVRDNYAVLENLGKRALIVTGKGGSAQRSGALDDVGRALEQLSIKWEVFNEVEANPSIQTVRKGAAVARSCQADFIIGIGGGSPLDSAKAIAVLARNEISDEELFALQFENVLPVIAIPTTAGTGSEVTPFSIITDPVIKAKARIYSPKIIAQIAFLDPLYTLDIPARITVDTAVDAYSHALESYFINKATPITRLISREAMRILGPNLKNLNLRATSLTPETRTTMLYGSLLAGMAISITGTTIPHTMGFSLTYLKDIPHGRANGMILPAYMDFNYSKTSGSMLMEAVRTSGFDDLKQFRDTMVELCGQAPGFSREEKDLIISQTLEANNIHNNIVDPTPEDIGLLLEAILAD